MKKQIQECFPCFTCDGMIFTRRSCYMEHSQANVDSLRSDHEESDSRMFANGSHFMELYSPANVVIWNIVKLALMP